MDRVEIDRIETARVEIDRLDESQLMMHEHRMTNGMNGEVR